MQTLAIQSIPSKTWERGRRKNAPTFAKIQKYTIEYYTNLCAICKNLIVKLDLPKKIPF